MPPGDDDDDDGDEKIFFKLLIAYEVLKCGSLQFPYKIKTTNLNDFYIYLLNNSFSRVKTAIPSIADQSVLKNCDVSSSTL